MRRAASVRVLSVFAGCIAVAAAACVKSSFDLGGGTATLVQQAVAQSGPATSSLTATLGTPPRDGDLLVMVGAFPCASIASVSGGGVPSWTRATASTTNANEEIWFGVVATTGSNDVTISVACSSTAFMNVSEWRGLIGDPSTVLDAAESRSGSGSPSSAPPLTTSHPSDLLFYAVSEAIPAAYDTPTDGSWQPLTPAGNPNIDQAVWYATVSSSLTMYQPSVSSTGSPWDVAIAAFRIAP